MTQSYMRSTKSQRLMKTCWQPGSRQCYFAGPDRGYRVEAPGRSASKRESLSNTLQPPAARINGMVICATPELKLYIAMLSEALPVPKRELHERLLLLVLAAIQFTAVVDFLIILPLGPQYMRVFEITPAQFGLIVSSYAISAGISGVTTGIFLDRFDRKRALLWLYLGFCVGTLFCALARTYHLLVLARAVAGAF